MDDYPPLGSGTGTRDEGRVKKVENRENPKIVNGEMVKGK